MELKTIITLLKLYFFYLVGRKVVTKDFNNDYQGPFSMSQ